MLNTPKTFKEVPSLKYDTYAVDLICIVFFIAEMVTKIKHIGLLGTEKVRLLLNYFLRYCYFLKGCIPINLQFLVLTSCLISGVFSWSLVNIWWYNGIFYLNFRVTSDIWVMWTILWLSKRKNCVVDASCSEATNNDPIHSLHWNGYFLFAGQHL